jgi:formylglycine-generating enzyme required for sulfatase activity
VVPELVEDPDGNLLGRTGGLVPGHSRPAAAVVGRSASREITPALVSIPGGRFTMGSDHGRPDERPRHAASVDAFELGRTPVTRAQYAAFLDASQVEAPPWWHDPAFADPRQPVVGITWFDATAYAAWLGPAWRLPSEAEWEWAARGGLPDLATPWGPTLPPGEVPDGPLAAPWPVGQGTPNGFGLCDIGTIVHEWCQDWYLGPYGTRPGPEPPTRRASRGGSWRHHVRWSPPAARSSLPPGFRYADYGFRVARGEA